MQITEKQKTLINLLFQELLKKGKKIQLKEVLDGVTQTKEAMNGLMDMDGAIFQYARDNDVEKQFQDAVMDAEINLKEESELIEQKPIKKEKETEVKQMENQNEENQNTQNNTIDWRNLPQTLPQTARRKKPRKQRILIEGDAVIEKVDLIFKDKIETTEKGAKFQRCPIIITFKSDAGDEVVEYYGGCRRWVNDDNSYSAPQFQKGGNSAVAKIFNRFCKKINVAEEQAQLFHLMQFLSEKPKCIVMTEDVLNPSTGKTIPKNAIMKFY